MMVQIIILGFFLLGLAIIIDSCMATYRNEKRK